MTTFNDLLYGGPRWSIHTVANFIDPFTIALGISAVASVASSFLANKSADDALDANKNIAAQNLAFDQEEARLGREIAERNRDEVKLGAEGPFGKVQFIDGVGWVTTLSDGQQRLLDAGEVEQLKQLTGDAAQARAGREDAADIARNAGVEAQTALLQAGDQTPIVRENERDRINAITSQGFNAGFDRSQDRGLTQAIRAGTSGDSLGAAIAGAGVQRGDALARLFAGNEGLVQQRFDQSKDSSGLLNKFGALARQAGGPSASPVPSNIGTGISQAAFINQLTGANSDTTRAAGADTGHLPFVPASFSTANNVQNLGMLATLFAQQGGFGTSTDRGLSNPDRGGTNIFGGA